MNDPSVCRLIANPYLLKPIQPPVNYSQGKSKEYIQRFLRSEYKDLYITESLVDHVSHKIKETLYDYNVDCIVQDCIFQMIDTICKEQGVDETTQYTQDAETNQEDLGLLPLLLPEPCDGDSIQDTYSIHDTSEEDPLTPTPHSSQDSDIVSE